MNRFRILPLSAAAVLIFLSRPAWAAPAIVHQPLLEAQLGQSVTIQATITDGITAVAQVRLFYRPSGTLGFRQEIMTSAGSTYTAVIPGSAVTSAGVDYYLEARNQAGEGTTSPQFNAMAAPHHLSVKGSEGLPAFRLLSPLAGSTVPPEQVVIVVAVDAGQRRLDLSTLTLFVGERNVTAAAQVTATMVSYVPPDDLADGLQGVRVTVRTQDGKESESPTWSFTVKRGETPFAAPDSQPAEDNLRFSGRLLAEVQYAALTRLPVETAFLSQPQNWLNRLTLNVDGQWGDLNWLGAFFLTSEEQPGRQPVNRMRLEFFTQTWRVVLGDFYPVFSDYSISNALIRGGGVLLTMGQPGEARSEFQAVGGYSRLAIEGRPDDAPGSFEQSALAARWLVDFFPGTGLALNYCTLNDAAQSISEPGGSWPASNHVATAEARWMARWTPGWLTRVYGEYAYSYYDESQTVTSIALGEAFRGGTRWEWTGGQAIEVEYRRTGATFESLANPWLSSDWEGISGNLQLHLINQDLVVLANTDLWRDNLNGQKSQIVTDLSGNTVTGGTTRNLNVSALIQARPFPMIPLISAGVNIASQQDDAEPVRQIDNRTLALNLGAGAAVNAGPGQVSANLAYSASRFDDLAVMALSGNLTAYSLTGNLMYVWSDWTWTLGGGVTQNQVDNAKVQESYLLQEGPLVRAQTLDYWLWNARAHWNVLPGQLAVDAGWEQLSGSDDLGLVQDRLGTFSLGGTYSFTPRHSLGLTLAVIGYTNAVQDSRSYGEWVVSTRYGIDF